MISRVYSIYQLIPKYGESNTPLYATSISHSFSSLKWGLNNSNSYGRGEEQLKREGEGGGEQQNFGGGVVRKTKKIEEEGNI